MPRDHERRGDETPTFAVVATPSPASTLAWWSGLPGFSGIQLAEDAAVICHPASERGFLCIDAEPRGLHFGYRGTCPSGAPASAVANRPDVLSGQWSAGSWVRHVDSIGTSILELQTDADLTDRFRDACKHAPTSSGDLTFLDVVVTVRHLDTATAHWNSVYDFEVTDSSEQFRWTTLKAIRGEHSICLKEERVAGAALICLETPVFDQGLRELLQLGAVPVTSGSDPEGFEWCTFVDPWGVPISMHGPIS